MIVDIERGTGGKKKIQALIPDFEGATPCYGHSYPGTLRGN